MNTVSAIRAKLHDARVTNVDGDWYVPRHKIEEIMTKHTIAFLVRTLNTSSPAEDMDLEIVRQSDLCEMIHQGAGITLAILIDVQGTHQLPLFLRLAQQTSQEIDKRLPLETETLTKYGVAGDVALDFCQAQWHFLVGSLQLSILPQSLDDRLILPLNPPQKFYRAAQGSSGTVTVVYVNTLGRNTDAAAEKYVRKQLIAEAGEKEFQTELRNLSILCSAKHPNITRLAAAYSHRNTHNFIFPLARHGALQDIFSGTSERQPAAIQSEQALASALVGLSSALALMHTFETHTLAMIGYHRDLKPANILIDNSKFILGDFGLSKVIPSQGQSSSTYPLSIGDYVAPECANIYHNELPRQRVGRSSDIWSFGSIMLDLVVFLKGGLDAFSHFRTKRMKKINHFKRHRFHEQDRLSPAVPTEFDRLRREHPSSTFCEGILPVIQAMLVLSGRDRPKARKVQHWLYLLRIRIYTEPVRDAFRLFDEQEPNQYIFVEYMRFEGWRSAAGIDQSSLEDMDKSRDPSRWEQEHEVIIRCLSELERLVPIATAGQNNLELLPLRLQIDMLLNSLPQDARNYADEVIERMLLEHWHQSWHASNILNKRVTLKAAMIEDSLASLEARDVNASDSFMIDLKAVKTIDQVCHFRKICVDASDNNQQAIALAEEKLCDWTDKISRHRHHARLQQAVELIYRAKKIREFHVLHCRGYYYDPVRLQSGLIYDYPETFDALVSKPISLQYLLQPEQSSKLTLGERFELGHALGSALRELHTVKWLHRRLSAAHIIYFTRGSTSPTNKANFYLVGFAQGRPARNLTDTDGFAEQEGEYYHHPAYLARRKDFRPTFDYYSLGILLLEIGMSQPLQRLCAEHSISFRNLDDFAEGEKFARSVVEVLVPELAFTAGARYCDLTRACLDGTLDGQNESADLSDTLSSFKTKVLDQLAKCKDAAL